MRRGRASAGAATGAGCGAGRRGAAVQAASERRAAGEQDRRVAALTAPCPPCAAQYRLSKIVHGHRIARAAVVTGDHIEILEAEPIGRTVALLGVTSTTAALSAPATRSAPLGSATRRASR